MIRSFLMTLIPVFAVSVYAYCIFLFFSFSANDTPMDYNFFVLFVCAIVAVIVNYRLALRERSIVTVAIANGVILAVTEALGFSTQDAIEGGIYYIMAAIVFFIPILCALIFSRNRISTNAMLIFCELSVVGTAFFFAIQLGDFFAAPMASVLCVIALVLNLCMLSALRASGPIKKAESVSRSVNRGMILAGVLAVLIATAIVAVVFLLPNTRRGLFTIIDAVRNFFIFVGEKIAEFVNYLLSLLPVREAAELDAAAQEALAAGDGYSEEMIEVTMGPEAAVIAGVIILAAICFIIYKMRKRRLKRQVQDLSIYEEKLDDDDSAMGFLRALFERFKAYLSFRWQLYLKRNTYEAAFVRIERFAARRGVSRDESETPQAYLVRLLAAVQRLPERGKSDRETDFHDFFDVVSAQVDRRLFSPANMPYSAMSAPDIQVYTILRSEMRRLRREKRFSR